MTRPQAPSRSAWVVVRPFLITLVFIGVVGMAASVFAQTDAPSMANVKITGEYGYHLPPDISKHGPQIDKLIGILHWFMAALFVGWGTFMAWCLIKFRQRPGHRATHDQIKAKPAKYLELGVIAFEAVLLLGFSIPIWGKVKNDLPTEADHPVHVRVLAEQFNWNFHYPGPDGVFGPTSPKFIDAATNPAGIDRNDPKGKDDVVSGELHIPKDRPVICDISSKDVIHSFSIPVLRIKQDAIPGMRIPVWFQAKEAGTYQVACAQLCGNNHYKMYAPLVVQSSADYDAWLKKKSAPAAEFNEDDLD